MSNSKHLSFSSLSLLLVVVVAGCGEREPAVGLEIPGSLRLAELSDDERARLEVTLAIPGVLDETPLALNAAATEASGEIVLPNVSEAKTAPFSLELRLLPEDDGPGETVLLARALGDITLAPNERNELSLAEDAFDTCGASQAGGPCSLLFDRNRNEAPNLEDLLTGVDPLPPPAFIDAAPDTLQFPSGIRLGSFARQVIVVENASASAVSVKASLVGAPGVTLSRYDTFIDAADGARRSIDLGVVQPFQEAFLAVSFAPVNPYLTTGAVFIEAYDAATRVRQATRVKVIANADGELQPPAPGFEMGALADSADLGGYLGAVQPFPTAELFNGLAVTGVQSSDVVSNGLPYTGRKIRAVFDEARGVEELPADAVFLVEVPPQNRLSVALAGLARDVDLGVLVLDDDDAVQADPAMNLRPVQSGNSPEAVELRNESSAPLRALVVLGRVESFAPPEAAPNALTESDPTSFDLQTTVSSAPEFTEPLAPLTGPIEGGNRVVLTGRGFHPNASVTFADAIALDCSHSELADGTTKLSCTTPPGSLLVGKNPATIVVANPSVDEGGDGQAATYPEGYTYQPPAPRLDDMSPRVAPTTGSTGAITLLGAFFSTRHGSPRVLFGQAEAASVTFIDAGRLEVTAPAQAPGVVSVTVQNRLGETDAAGNPLFSLKSNSRSFTYIQSAGPPPQLTGLDPGTGSVDGGDTVTVSGSNFALDAQVTFDALPSGSVTWVSGESLSVKVPARTAPGVVDVEVVNADGQTSRLAGAYTYFIPSPTVTNAFPAEASTTGGTFIVVSGTGFRAGVQVLFTSPAGTPISSPNVNRVSTGTLLVATPAVSDGGDYGIEVINVDGQSASYAGTFRYLEPAGPAPRIDTIDPPSGFKEQPNLVTLTGNDFRGPPAILVGSDTAEVASFTDNDSPEKDVITFYTPVVAQAGPVVVRLINSDGQSDTSVFTYFTDLDAPPQIFQVTPSQGKAGDVVTVRGSGFDADDTTQTLAAGAQLLVRGGSVQPTSATNSEVVFTLPTVQTTSPLTLEITVVNGDGQRSSGSFLYVPPAPPAPAITQVTPASGPTGTNVVVSGSNLNVTQLRIGTISVPSSSFTASATQVSFAIPSQLQPSQALIRLSNADGQSATAPFTVTAPVVTPLAPPAIHALTPAEVPPAGGAQVTVTGAGFSTTGGQLRLSGTTVSGAVFTATTVTFTAPAKAEGTYTLSVVNADGQAASTSLRYQTPTSVTGTPVLGIVVPGEVHALVPGDAITVTGQNLAGVTAASLERATGGTSLGAVTISSKTDAAVTVQNSLALAPSDAPATGTAYRIRLTGPGINLASPPFTAKAPNIIYFDAGDGGDDMFLFGEMLNPTKLSGALFTDASGKNADVPLLIAGKSESFLFGSTGGATMLPGVPYELTLSYTGAAGPVVPFPPGTTPPSMGPPPLSLNLNQRRVPAATALGGSVHYAWVDELHRYSDVDLGAPQTWVFRVEPLAGGAPVATGTWARLDDSSMAALTFDAGTLPVGQYRVVLATDKTPQLAINWDSPLEAALPSLQELNPSLVNEGGLFAVSGDLFNGNRIVAAPAAGGTAVELLVVSLPSSGPGGEIPDGADATSYWTLVPTTGLLPGDYEVCALTSSAPLACETGVPLQVQAHPCGTDAVPAGLGGRFTLTLDQNLPDLGCGLIGTGKGLSFDVPLHVDVEVRFVSTDAPQIGVVLGEGLCSGAPNGECLPPEEVLYRSFMGSHQLFFVEPEGSGTSTITVDVIVRAEGRCVQGDLDGDGFDRCSGDCAEGDASVGPAADEICDNGIDDDCDGVENYLGSCEVTGVFGVCAEGALMCDVSGTPVCEQVNSPGDEVCSDSLDNNCDGNIDEQPCVEPAGEGFCGDGFCDPDEPQFCPTDCGGAGGCGDGFCDATEASDPQMCPEDCEGQAQCGNGFCEAGEDAFNCVEDCGNCGDDICSGSETPASCPIDCGGGEVCGDSICNGSETPLSCPSDCGGGGCGDAICGAGEDPFNCPADCAVCGDDLCSFGEEGSCPADCGGEVCGDAICGPGEDSITCEQDCGAGVCGDAICGPGEDSITCEQDCGAGGGVCGDAICGPGEDTLNCEQDCAICGDGFCTSGEDSINCPGDCGAGGFCGDAICDPQTEDPQICPTDCGP